MSCKFGEIKASSTYPPLFVFGRTAGVNVQVTDLSIRIMEIVAEPGALAARARVATDLDVDIPLSVIQKPLKNERFRGARFVENLATPNRFGLTGLAEY